MKLSEKLTFLRKDKGWSQEQLANKLSVSRQAIYKWEADIATPEIEKLKKLSTIFGISLDDLLDEEISLPNDNYQNEDNVETEKNEEIPIVEINNIVEQGEASSQKPPKKPSRVMLILIISLSVIASLIILSAVVGILVSIFNNHEHDFSDWMARSSATCKNTGLEFRKCEKCGEEETREIPKTAHAETTIYGYAPTCEGAGLTNGKKCAHCGEILFEQRYISPLGHNEKIVKGEEVSCTKDGISDGKKCTTCDKILVSQEIIKAKGHTEATIEGKDATCTETGLTEGKNCTVCKEILVAQQIIPINENAHLIVSIEAKESTCTQTGLTEGKKCSACNEILQQQTIMEIKPHTYVNDVCSACGKHETLYLVLNSEENGYIVSGVSEVEYPGKLIIPSVYKGLPVTEISANAFNGNTQIVDLTIPNSVTTIGTGALKNMSSMKELVIGNGITSVEKGMLYGASSLEDITIPFVGKSPDLNPSYEEEGAVISAGENTFGYIFGETYYESSFKVQNFIPGTHSGIYGPMSYLPTSLKNVTISTSCPIYVGAFQYIPLETLTIPKGVGFGGFGTFGEISKVNFLGTLEDWCNLLFNNISDNPCAGGADLYFNGELVTEVTLGYVPAYAFFGCASITKATVNGEIGTCAFDGCTNLTSITIGSNTKTIYPDAFFSCPNLSQVNYVGTVEEWCNITFATEASNPVYQGADFNLNGEILTELLLPNTVTAINNYTFYGFSSLTSVIIPDSVTTIGWYAFANCKSLDSIVIPASVTKIDAYAFMNCDNLTISCKAVSKPANWNENWNSSECTVKWGQ